MKVLIQPQWFEHAYLGELRNHLVKNGADVPEVGRSLIDFARVTFSQRWDLLHLHWLSFLYQAKNPLTMLVRLTVSLACIGWLSLRGTRIVWTAHNIKNHEDSNPRTDQFVTQFVLDRSDSIIVHCDAARKALCASFNLSARTHIHVIPHGHFCDSYPNQVTPLDARRELDVPADALVLLFFGQIRPYKGVLELVKAFARLEVEDAILLIAGKPIDAESSFLISKEAKRDGRVIYCPGYVPDEGIQTYMNACDIAVLPYRDILTSGAAILAMSFSRPFIAPRMGCLVELGHSENMIEYVPGKDGLYLSLQEMLLRRDELKEMGMRNLNDIRQLDWGDIARRTMAAYAGEKYTP